MSEEKEEEFCEPCAFSAAIGISHNVCSTVLPKDFCEDLFDKVVNEKISVGKYLKTMKKKLEDAKKTEADVIDELIVILKEEGYEEEDEAENII